MNTQLQDAILSRDMSYIMHVLKTDPLSIHHKNEVGFTALMISCTTEQPEVAALLLDAGSDVHARSTETGFSALHCVVAHPPMIESNSVRLVEMLLARNAEIDSKTVNGETPLMFAAWFNNLSAVRYLLSKGARIGLSDYTGRSAKDLALLKGNKNVAALLS